MQTELDNHGWFIKLYYNYTATWLYPNNNIFIHVPDSYIIFFFFNQSTPFHLSLFPWSMNLKWHDYVLNIQLKFHVILL